MSFGVKTSTELGARSSCKVQPRVNHLLARKADSQVCSADHAILAVWLCRAGETLIVLAALGSKIEASSCQLPIGYKILLLL